MRLVDQHHHRVIRLIREDRPNLALAALIFLHLGDVIRSLMAGLTGAVIASFNAHYFGWPHGQLQLPTIIGLTAGFAIIWLRDKVDYWFLGMDLAATDSEFDELRAACVAAEEYFSSIEDDRALDLYHQLHSALARTSDRA